MYDYGARWYDAAVGRFMNVDPMADETPAWSPYTYTMNNPVRLVDRDGRAVEDIIITAKRNDETNSKARTFAHLQSLTSQKLSMDRKGNISIIKGVGNKNASETGTKLVADLINDHSKIIKITNDVSYSGIKKGVLIHNAVTQANNKKNASNGTGTGSTIYYSPDVNASFEDINCNKNKAPANRVLGHELIHADHNRTGTREISKSPVGDFGSNREEQKTVIRENKMFKKQRYDGTNGKYN